MFLENAPKRLESNILTKNPHSKTSISTNFCFVKDASKGSCNSQISVSIIPNTSMTKNNLLK